MSKKEAVKNYVRKKGRCVVTVEIVHFAITGNDGAAQWHEKLFDVSKSTVRRALDEMDNDDEVDGYYKYGHCYDKKRYKVC